MRSIAPVLPSCHHSSTLAVALALSLSQIAGVPVECPRDWSAASQRVTGSADHTGYFDYQRRVIGLDPSVCLVLHQLVAIPERRFLRSAYDVLGFSVFVFAHEMQHMAGITDETQADCGAAKTFGLVAAELGLSRRFGVKLATASRGIDGYHPAANDCWP